jgi:hypothetical protein
MSTVIFENSTSPDATTVAKSMKHLNTALGRRCVSQADIARINKRNRLFDGFCACFSAILMGCVAACVVVTAGWFVSTLAAEMSSWSLAEFLHAVGGTRLV